MSSRYDGVIVEAGHDGLGGAAVSERISAFSSRDADAPAARAACLMLHHRVGDLGDGRTGTRGFPRGGGGAVTRALADAARTRGATVRTGSEAARIDVRDGVATSATYRGGVTGVPGRDVVRRVTADRRRDRLRSRLPRPITGR